MGSIWGGVGTCQKKLLICLEPDKPASLGIVGLILGLRGGGQAGRVKKMLAEPSYPPPWRVGMVQGRGGGLLGCRLSSSSVSITGKKIKLQLGVDFYSAQHSGEAKKKPQKTSFCLFGCVQTSEFRFTGTSSSMCNFLTNKFHIIYYILCIIHYHTSTLCIMCYILS